MSLPFCIMDLSKYERGFFMSKKLTKKIKPSFYLTATNIISLLYWWEIPSLILFLCILNGIAIYDNYNKSALLKLNIALCVAAAVLSVLNWDLEIGTKLLRAYRG